MTVSRWIDGVLEKNELIDQDSNLRAIVYWGHAPNSQSRGLEMKQAMEKVDLMVIIDPYPTAAAAMPDRKDGVYLLPAATQFETSGIGDRVEPLDPVAREGDRAAVRVEARPHDHVRLREEASASATEFVKNIKLVKDKTGWDEPADRGHAARDQRRHLDHRLHRPVARAPEGPHAPHAALRREDAALRRRSVVDKETGYDIEGDYFGLPWPCYGNAGAQAPGLADPLSTTSKHVMDGGGYFRANFGVTRDGVDLLAADGSHSKDSEITTGYPEFDHVLHEEAGLVERAHARGAEGGRGQELEDRPLRRHPARVHR